MNIINVLLLKRNIKEDFISQLLNISSKNIYKRINKLRKFGYLILYAPKEGYSLVRNIGPLNKYEIKASINENLDICKKIKCYKKINSTQTLTKEFAEKGFKEGLIVFSDIQTKGYGRNKDMWESNIGGLWFSILLRPKIPPNAVYKLLFLFSNAIKNIVEENYNIDCEMKWPNDILVYGKKLAGTIIEMSVDSNNILEWIVIGIGINVNNNLSEYLETTAISIKSILKREINITKFISLLLKKIDILYKDFINETKQ
ncbi:MAG: biotin--[acetyl-CoA-carboxylase] ligase [Endomicrobium sp.]|jgi:BirA family biotin operon repressor/biotin-[acetyl-CoA-carboxylase] ligase|nr:biotin--[acetyl-CoA-carboxylase] ligase [Endomicrobium sp.]